MSLKRGTVLYRYTIKDNIFRVREGVVDSRDHRLYVNFRDGGQGVMCPRSGDIGKIQTTLGNLWLDKRDDAMAKKLFIKYEFRRITELRELIKRKEDMIAMLKEGDIHE